MAPSRANRGKKAKETPAVIKEPTASQQTPILKGLLYTSPSVHDDIITSLPVPGSPVTKVTPSIEPSPVLSATNGTTIEEFKTVDLPSLNFAGELSLDIDWSQFDDRPKRKNGKTKSNKAKNHSLASEEDQATVEDPSETLEPPPEPRIEYSDKLSAEKKASLLSLDAENQSKFVSEAHQNQTTDSSPHLHTAFHTPLPYYTRVHPWYSAPMSSMPYGYGPSPRDGSPYRTSYGHYPPYPQFAHPSNLQRHDSMGSRGSAPDMTPHSPLQIGADSASAIEDDPDLLSRVHGAIPDLEHLLRRYKETHGELGLREAFIRKKEAESAEIIKHKEEHIGRLMAQFHDAETKHAKEHNKMRFHVGRLEESIKEMEERLDLSEAQRSRVDAANKELSGQKTALMRERMIIAKAAAQERGSLIKEFEQWKATSNRLFETEQKRAADMSTMNDDLRAKANSAQEQLERALQMQTDLEQQLADEKDSNASGFEARKEAMNKAYEEKHQNLAKEFEEKQLALTKDFEEKHQALTEAIKEKQQVLEKEVGEKQQILDKDYEEKEQALTSSTNEQIESLKKAHKDDLNEQTKGFVSLQEILNKKMTVENQNLHEEMEALKLAWDADKTRFEGIISEMKQVATTIEQEKGRLTEVVEALEDLTAVKSEGDSHQ